MKQKVIRTATLLLALPFLFIVFINATGSAPTFEYRPDRCTRYCEQHGCLHERMKYESRDILVNQWWYRLYRLNVRLLDAIPFLDYREANLLVYMTLYPLAGLFLLYRLMKRDG